MLKLVLMHNELTEGKFPLEELRKIDHNISIVVDITDEPFTKKITIDVESDTDPINLAYTIGQFVGVYQGLRIS